MRGAWLFAAGLACALAVAAPAPAARADADAAVELTKQAGELFTKGDYAAALERYQRADALVRRQTIVLRIARCLDKLGRLLESLDKYQAVIDMELSPDLEPRKRALQEEAIQQAKTERADLEGRVPTVAVRVTGPADVLADARVTIDQKPIEPSKVSAPIRLDPGHHEIVVTSGDEEERTAVTLVATDHKDVDVQLKGRDAPVVVDPPRVVNPPIDPKPPVVVDPDAGRDTGKARRITGGVFIGVGGVGLVLGTIWGAAIVAKHGQLVDECGEDLACPPSQTREVEGYNEGRIGSTALLVVGGVVAATGIILVVTALPPKASPPAPKTALVVRPGGLAIAGSF